MFHISYIYILFCKLKQFLITLILGNMEESFDKDVSFSNNNNISKSVPQSPKLNRSR